MRSNTETTPDFELRMDLTTSLSILFSLLFSFLLPLSLSRPPCRSSCAYTRPAKELSQRVLFTLDSCGRSSIKRSRRKPPSAIPSAEFCDPCRPPRLCTVCASVRPMSRCCVKKEEYLLPSYTFGLSQSFSCRTIGVIL